MRAKVNCGPSCGCGPDHSFSSPTCNWVWAASGVSASADAGGWLLLPGDMPTVQPSTLLAVAAKLPHHVVVYAQYRGQRGHPVGFSPELYSELVQLSGDEGARRDCRPAGGKMSHAARVQTRWGGDGQFEWRRAAPHGGEREISLAGAQAVESGQA